MHVMAWRWLIRFQLAASLLEVLQNEPWHPSVGHALLVGSNEFIQETKLTDLTKPSQLLAMFRFNSDHCKFTSQWVLRVEGKSFQLIH